MTDDRFQTVPLSAFRTTRLPGNRVQIYGTFDQCADVITDARRRGILARSSTIQPTGDGLFTMTIQTRSLRPASNYPGEVRQVRNRSAPRHLKVVALPPAPPRWYARPPGLALLAAAGLVALAGVAALEIWATLAVLAAVGAGLDAMAGVNGGAVLVVVIAIVWGSAALKTGCPGLHCVGCKHH